MTNTYVTKEEATAFLAANPTVRWIDVFVYDMNGHPRGKRLRREDLASIADRGIMMPASVFIMDPRGNCIEETGRLWENGDPDFVCRLLSGTLASVPVGACTHAQAVIVPEADDELDPRFVLAKQAASLASAGLTAVSAVELEFYVTRPTPSGAFSLDTPQGLSNDPDSPMTFQFDDMDALGPMIDDIYRICAAQNLPVDAVMQESGPGQFEINLKHKSDAMSAALDGLLLKRAVKAAANTHNLNATFMPKPHHDWSGSGMHLHMSLVDKTGSNIFAGAPISQSFQHALGGLATTMADFMAIWAQSGNAYRRYVPKSYVAMAPHWGFNNRTVALRIPAGPAAATRVEHRVSGSDANPYLVLAAIMAGVQHGMNNKINPGPAVTGNSEEVAATPLPTNWGNALAHFKSSPVVREAFGAAFQDVYFRLKDTERTSFERIVTQVDHDWYAHVA